MAYTLLMTVVLVVSFLLMFGLVKFSEGIISRRELESTTEDSSIIASEM
jgi:Flp pilus assembly protein TadG